MPVIPNRLFFVSEVSGWFSSAGLLCANKAIATGIQLFGITDHLNYPEIPENWTCKPSLQVTENEKDHARRPLD